MINIIKCSYGHYYDSMVFPKCPHCETKNFDKWESSQYKQKVSEYASAYIQEQISGSLAESPVQVKSTAQKEKAPDETLTLKNPLKKRITDDGNTVGFMVKNKGNYFVTGWLVCVNGPDIGHSFNLHYGYNTIGYRVTNSICLIGDISEGKDIHCSIVYEDKKNQFYLVPEQDTKTLLNGVPIEKPTVLATGDLIGIGLAEFEFIAFCRENRKWDKGYLKKEI